MLGVARNFFTLAIIFAICGMMLGLHMSITEDHSQAPVHAHLTVAGWLMSGFFAFFYHFFGEVRDTMLARVHFWLHAVTLIGLTVSLYILLGGNTGIAPVTAASSIGFFASVLLFAAISLPVVWRR